MPVDDRRSFVKRMLACGAVAACGPVFAVEPETVRYRSNPALKTVLDGYPGVVMLGNVYSNDGFAHTKKFSSILKWWSRENPQEAEKKADISHVPVKPSPGLFSDSVDKIVWLGHSSFYLCLGGKTLLLDPIFFDLPFRRRTCGLPFDGISGAPKADYLLISHGHYDHLDSKSIKAVSKDSTFALVPLSMGRLIRKRLGNIRCQEAGWYQEYALPDEPFHIIFLPARHWYKRGLGDTNTVLWGSFLIRYKGRSIYFCGDSGYGSHFTQIEKLFGPVDYCLMPIGAYKPPFIMQENHLSPQEALTAFHDLQGRYFIPMHYGAYDLSDEPMGEPLRLLRSLYDTRAGKDALYIPAIGEGVVL